jgi:hypothetical protein
MMEIQKNKLTINFKEDAMKAKSNEKVRWLVSVLFLYIIMPLLWQPMKVMALSEKNWLQVNQDGFGYPADLSASGKTKLFVFDEKFYAMNDYGVFQMEDGYSKVWKKLPISGTIIPLENYMYRRENDQLWQIPKGKDPAITSNWQKITSVGLPGGVSPYPWVIFNNKLYGKFKSLQAPFEIWRSGDIGKTVMNWQKVVANSFNDPINNYDVQMMLVFKNHILIGTKTNHYGVEIWESASGDAGTWNQVNIDGFGTYITLPPDPTKIYTNHDIYSWSVYNGFLYVGTFSTKGGEVWRYNGTGKNGWQNVTPPGEGPGSGPGRNESMVVFENELYLAEGFPSGCLKKYNGTNWSTVVQYPPFCPENDGLGSLAVYKNRLYVSTQHKPYSNVTKGDQIYGYPFPPVTLITPNGNESWKGGTQQAIKWHYILDPLVLANRTYKIEYSTNNGATYHKIAEYSLSITKPDGILTDYWQAPNTPSTQCRIRITVKTKWLLSGALDEWSDASDSPFIITPTDNPITFRINAGGPLYIDQAGNKWEADRAFNPPIICWCGYGYVGGYTYATNDTILNSANSPLFQTERWGMSAYRFIVPNGDYKVRLLFSEIWFQQPNCRVMGVTIEGNPLCTHLDLYAQAGHDAALELVCPARVLDGCLDVEFSASINFPKLSAIEVVSGTPLRDYRMNCGGGLYYDQAGNQWDPDRPFNFWTRSGYVGGNTYTTNDAIANTIDDPLYQSERWGMSAYRFFVPPGKYTVRLLFAEIWYNAASKRLMSAKIEGALKLNNLDIYSKVGHDAAMVYAFPVQVNDGFLDMEFSASVDNPKLAAIEIISHEFSSGSSSVPKIEAFNEDSYPEEQVPTKYELAQNYPNPFNPITTIEYQLPHSAEVQLTIYNIQGQMIRRLVCEAKSAGRHAIQWNGRDEAGQPVASGMYIYRIEATPTEIGQQGFIEVKRMMLLK